MFKVMLVDDEPFILEGLKNIIDWDELGLEITAEASDGLQALEILSSTKIDILLTDIKMPNMNGIELIKKARAMSLNFKTIILSGYDDFAFVKEGILLGIENYLLKSIDEKELTMTLINTIEKIESELCRKIKSRQDESILKENILYRWVTGKINSSELFERAALFDIDISCEAYQVCLLKLLEGTHPASIADNDLKKFAVLNICNELIGNPSNGIAFNGLFDEIIILFKGNMSHIGKLDISDVIKKFIENINSFLGINIFAAIGPLVKKCNEVQNSYNCAKSLMDYSLIMPGNTLIDYHKQEKLIKERQNIFEIDFDVLKKSINLKERNKSREFIDNIFAKLDKSSWLTPTYLRDISVEILYNILSSARTTQQDISALRDSTESLFAKLLNLKSKSEMSEWLKLTAETVIDKLSAEDGNLNPLIKRIINYIDSNYAEEISLKTLSAKFNANAAYLGRLFNDEKGEMFSNYLNRVRVEKAKELLLKGKLAANEVAQKVGYTNPKYFSEIFKKMTGKNPLQFKRDIGI